MNEELQLSEKSLVNPPLRNWQGRKEWFFNREHTDTYELWYEGHIHEGLLTCPNCNRLYPIIHGVPIMIPDNYREAQLEQPFFVKWESQLSLETKEKATQQLKGISS